jgi:multiple sugar transport system ATP-binding protein
MTVAENIGFPLKVKHVPKAEIRERVVEAARLLDLTAFLDRKPANLSGGQRQRVAMGRAIVRKPEVFLMDEPLSNLDAKLRVATRAQIASLQRRLEVTTVYVTHDQVEAMTMGDRVAVLRDGVLQQCDTPRVLFDHPVNIFVAGFIGSPAMNLMVVPLDGEVAKLGPLTVPVTSGERKALSGDKVVIGVRPEGFAIVGPDAGLPAVVEVVEELGSDSFVHATATIADEPQVIVARTESKDAPARGAKIGLALRSDDTHKFDPDGGRSLEKLAD